MGHCWNSIFLLTLISKQDVNPSTHTAADMALGFDECTFIGVPCLTSAHPACLTVLLPYCPPLPNLQLARPSKIPMRKPTPLSPECLASHSAGWPAPYSRLASGVSFSTLSHCGLRKCKPLLLSDQAKYSQGVSVTKRLALLERKVLEGASSRELPGADSQVLVRLIPQTEQNMEMSPNISPSMNLRDCSLQLQEVPVNAGNNHLNSRDHHKPLLKPLLC